MINDARILQEENVFLGNYYGIIENEKLVAIAGERLQSDFLLR